MKKPALLLVVFGLAVSGCSSTQTVQYYKAHQAALETRLDDCVATGEDSRDCRNVRQAYAELHNTPDR